MEKEDVAFAIRERGTTMIWQRLLPSDSLVYLIFGNKYDAQRFIDRLCNPEEQKVLEIVEVKIISKINQHE